MQALKALVIVMGLLIVVGVVAVAATISYRLGRLADSAAPAVAGPGGFAAVELAIPEGCRAVEAAPAGERLVLRLGDGRQCNRVLIVDMNSGALLGRLDLVPAP
ncbi:MAG: hypothetical protein WD099_00120 [Dongiaceae bacterium]